MLLMLSMLDQLRTAYNAMKRGVVKGANFLMGRVMRKISHIFVEIATARSDEKRQHVNEAIRCVGYTNTKYPYRLYYRRT